MNIFISTFENVYSYLISSLLSSWCWSPSLPALWPNKFLDCCFCLWCGWWCCWWWPCWPCWPLPWDWCPPRRERLFKTRDEHTTKRQIKITYRRMPCNIIWLSLILLLLLTAAFMFLPELLEWIWRLSACPVFICRDKYWQAGLYTHRPDTKG